MTLDEEIENDILLWFSPHVVYSQSRIISNLEYIPNDTETIAFIQTINNTYQAHMMCSKNLSLTNLPCDLVAYILDYISYQKLNYVKVKYVFLKAYYDSIYYSLLEPYYPTQTSHFRTKVANKLHQDIVRYTIKYKSQKMYDPE